MKKVFIRENIRSNKIGNGQLKSTHSQSPPQRNIIKKLQLKHTDPINKSDYSLQDKLVFQEAKPKESDFKAEIERRYNQSCSNSIYIFPRKQEMYKESIDSQTSINTSTDSLKHVTVYDLSSQNNKTRRQNKAYDSVTIQMTPREYELNASKMKNEKNYKNMLTENYKNEKTENSEMSKGNEVRSKDKTQQSYKRLLNLLDKQRYISPNSTKAVHNSYHQNHSNENLQNFIPLKQANKQTAKHQTLKSKLSERTLKALATYSTYSSQPLQLKDTKSKSQEKRSEYNSLRKYDDNINLSASVYSKGFNKTLTRDNFVPFIDTSIGVSKSVKNNISLSTKAVNNEGRKFKEDSMKRIYNNNMLRSMAPQSSKNVLSVKDNILKIDLSDNYHHYRPISPSNTLYKKAQIEVLNHKKKPETTKQEVEKPRKQDSLVTLTVLSPTEREDNPKECVKNLHSINSYVSPSALTTIHSSQSKLSKKSSLKTTFVVSPSEKKKEKPVYVSHELSKDAVYKKTPFKLNLSKRNQDNRDALTSTRSRGKFPSDKLSEIRNYDSILKTSYELSQYNSFGNASTPQKNGAKRTLNLPYHNSVKIIPLTKVSSQIK